jgi:hypothetical protein
MIAVSSDDYLWFVDQALDGMVAIVGELGDDRANRRPGVEGANSAYVILTHCLGVMEFWGGMFVAGRSVERDRAAEFRAQGPVAELIARVPECRRRLESDLALADPTAAPRHAPGRGDADLPVGRSQGGVILHIYEELAQHFGQMEVTRDVILAAEATPYA